MLVGAAMLLPVAKLLAAATENVCDPLGGLPMID